jgi:hypothetical protein
MSIAQNATVKEDIETHVRRAEICNFNQQHEKLFVKNPD